jgi:hypothetical protein
MREHLKRSDIYVNPNNEVFVIGGREGRLKEIGI